MEFVFVVPRAELFRDCYPQGLVRFGDAFPRRSFEACVREHGFFVERAYAERTPELKQIIPYGLAVRGERILAMRRLRRGGEERLHDKLSIGVGGHVNPEDAADRDGLLRAATHREVTEELVVEGGYGLSSVGLLNDDSNPVGAVHVGLVQVLHLEGPVGIREQDVLEGWLATAAELRELRGSGADFETWSSILIDHLDVLLPEPVPSTT